MEKNPHVVGSMGWNRGGVPLREDFFQSGLWMRVRNMNRCLLTLGAITVPSRVPFFTLRTMNFIEVLLDLRYCGCIVKINHWHGDDLECEDRNNIVSFNHVLKALRLASSSPCSSMVHKCSLTPSYSPNHDH